MNQIWKTHLSKKHFTPYFQVNDKTAYPKYIEFRDKVEYHKKLISEETNLQEIILDSTHLK